MPPCPPPMDDPLAPGSDRPQDPCTLAALSELCACHERFEEVLDVLRELQSHLPRQGPDAWARSAAARVLAFVDGEAPAHREKEERELLPLLRRLGGAGGVVLAGRLEAEHGLLARAWGQCHPALDDLASQGRWSSESAAFEFERWRDFAALATAHMLAENGAAYPAAAALMTEPPPGR